ncbi:adenylyl-sulfate kinase [Paenibacillus sp. N4]|uniref:adenylyl-sulfate kinase n=1 Tax=Paenibacillus vietnamensis TaxID=2590547 RepID=UPI001CD152F9|nr:adenylyl-sulfate kinase [Paenibacillus vietnamensis]MCA0755705.1 adenylyl-sulfate kinase [Paenibacillus vietnamensis]
MNTTIATPNLVWHKPGLTREDRHSRNGHKGCVLWFTGLSGSGKSTLAYALEQELFARHVQSYVLDGDNVRHGLNRDLGFSAEDRKENVRRIGEVSKLFADAGMIVLAAFISPNQEDRDMVRSYFADEEFLEIYVRCSLEECERRDPKGLYRRARKGEIAGFTGISAPYDIPRSPDLVIDTEVLNVEQSVASVLEALENRSYLK